VPSDFQKQFAAVHPAGEEPEHGEHQNHFGYRGEADAEEIEYDWAKIDAPGVFVPVDLTSVPVVTTLPFPNINLSHHCRTKESRF
jgi:hypothetical protein